MDADKGRGMAESQVEGNASDVETEGNFEEANNDDFVDAEGCVRPMVGGAVQEPCVGMEFESEDDAKRFYEDYARGIGFSVRAMQRRRSETDGGTNLSWRLGCNKQGVSPNLKSVNGPEQKVRSTAPEGCKAAMLFKMRKSGRWVVTRFLKEHNHPLVVTSHDECVVVRDKDKKIRELAQELQQQDQLCAEYREALLHLLSSVKKESDKMNSRVLAVVESVQKSEAEALAVSLKH